MSTVLPQYPFDPTGLAETNLVSETQAIRSRGMLDHYYVIPRSGPFYADSVKLRLYPAGTNVNNPAAGLPLEEGVHYSFGYHFAQASHTIGKAIYAAITFYDRALEGQLRMQFQTIGGEWVLDDQAMTEVLANTAYNPRIATWEQVTELPVQFPVVNHDFNIDDFVGMGDVVDMLEEIGQSIVQKNEGGMVDHMENTANPHQVTKEQVGLGLVDNYPVAAPAEATGGLVNNRYMTPLRTKQLIDAVAMLALNNHMSDANNPHAVTKAQVGLGNVQNYALSSQAEAEAGSSNARYMTPLRVREAIEAIVANAFTAHAGDRGNPHAVTKAQVGLGNVPNIGLATDEAALEGFDHASIITPRLLSLVLGETVGADLLTHMGDFENPHGVTKAQVGLGWVQNYGIANQAEAGEGTSNEKYMTPLATRYAINALVGGSSNAHMVDFENPHKVTAAQVGTYDKAGIDALLANKIGLEDTAADATKAFGMDQPTFQAWVRSQQVADSSMLAGKTYDETKADILTGTAANADLLGGKDYATLVNEVTGTVGGSLEELTGRLDDLETGNSLQFNYPAIRTIVDEGGTQIEVPVHWIKIGTVDASSADPTVDTSLIVSVGMFSSEYNADKRFSALVEIGGAASTLGQTEGEIPGWDGCVIKALTPGTLPFTVGYIQEGSDVQSIMHLYVKLDNAHHDISVTELSYKRFTAATVTVPASVADLTTAEPTGMFYPRVFTEGSAEIKALQDFVARKDNPHQVTKAQVGLGLVDNYGTASPSDALIGTATNKFMTPALVSARVDQELDATLAEMASVFDEGLALFQ